VAKAATMKLSVEHDLDREKLNGFLEALRSRAIQQGWYESIFRINQGGQVLNLIESYGTLTRQSIDAEARAHIFAENRRTQDTINLFACLEETLNQEARDTMYAESDTYTYRRGDILVPLPAGMDPEEKRRDGVMFLWSIINRTTARTNATIAVIIHQLNHLESVMTESNSDITTFNTKVRKLLNSYYANKRVVFDEQVLLTNLADAYKTCKDNEFVSYVNRKWQDHIDESHALTATEFMELAMKQYQTMIEQSKWGVDNSRQGKQIMNLASQIGNLRRWKSEKDKKEGDGKHNNVVNHANNGKQNSSKVFVDAKTWQKQRYESAPEWMKKKPVDESKSLKRGKHTYHWCNFHKLWQKHEPKDYRLNPINKDTVAGSHRNQRSSISTATASNANDNSEDKEDRTVRFNTPRTTIAAAYEGLVSDF
jgi:hypothetical protein